MSRKKIKQTESLSLTVDEQLRLLRDNDCPVIVVEGKGDTQVYGWLLDKVELTTANLHACGGKDKLDKIFEAVRKDLSKYPTVKLFIRDSDLFVFEPCIEIEKYRGICFTAGYSIENDLYADAQEIIANMLNSTWITKKNILIHHIARYMAFAYEQKHDDRQLYDFNFQDTNDFDRSNLSLTNEFLAAKNFTEPDPNMVDNIANNYALLLRGHNLFAILNSLFLLQKSDGYPSYKVDELKRICFAVAINKDDGYINAIKKIIISRLATYS